MRLKHILIIVLTLALFGGLGSLWLSPARITQAPDITVTTLQGDKLSLTDLRGKPVLVTF